MVTIKQFKPAPSRWDTRNPKLRIPSRACSRCRSLHRKCDITSKVSICSNCERASAPCRGGGNQELRFRFSGFGQRPQSRAPDTEQGLPSPTQAASPLPDENGLQGPSNPRSPGNGQNIIGTAPLLDSTSPVFIVSQQPHTSGAETSSSSSSSSSSSPAPSLSSNSPSYVYSPKTPALGAQSKSGCTTSDFSSPSQHRIHHEHASGCNKFAPIEHDTTAEFRHRVTKCRLRSRFGLANKEAQLVKHFWAVLLPWFDYCDPRAHFRSYIQATMSREPGILFAILAVSARHLEAIGDEYYNSNEYERECLGLMIPMFNGRNDMQEPDDGLLVSALLLRCLEEMTRTDDHRPPVTHTVSASLLLRITQHNSDPSELSDATMAVALRQEIYIANRLKRPIELEGRNCGIDDSLTSAPDFIWTFRIMSHAARVTNFAYSNDPRSRILWDQLWEYLEDWDRARPSSFNPLNDFNRDSALDTLSSQNHNQSADGARIFPEIYFVSDCPVAGNQYLQLCKILLLAHDPRTPTLGLGRTRSIQTQEEKIRQAVRVVCGVSLSNPEYTAARILAGLVIGMAGELFKETSETVQLLEIVSKAEMHIGWPGIKVSPQLQEFWGLDERVILDSIN
ncbi:hypothetical protein F5Y03DRAFT_359695 [Xylaria venustula]|nr:hypothetical protein F5Y03DRAFT_359695 [Xylaria venustula]